MLTRESFITSLHYWAVLVRADILKRDSAESPGVDLGTELTRTYLKAVGDHPLLSAYELIGRGLWVSWNPIQDDLTPEEVFSDGRVTYQL